MGLYDLFSAFSQAKKASSYAAEQRKESEKSPFQKWKDYIAKNNELGIDLQEDEMQRELGIWAKQWYGKRYIEPTIEDVASESSIEKYTKRCSAVSDLIYKFNREILQSEKYKSIFLNDAKEIYENLKNNPGNSPYSKKIAGAMNKYLSEKLEVSSQIPETLFFSKVDGYEYDNNSMDKYAKADMRYTVDIEVQTTQELLLEILKILQSSSKAIR